MIRSMNRLKARELSADEIRQINGGEGTVEFEGGTGTCPLFPDRFPLLTADLDPELLF